MELHHRTELLEIQIEKQQMSDPMWVQRCPTKRRSERSRAQRLGLVRNTDSKMRPREYLGLDGFDLKSRSSTTRKVCAETVVLVNGEAQ